MSDLLNTEGNLAHAFAANLNKHEITASAETLMRQGWMTADEYLRYAVECIDERIGEKGYAKKHPELIGAFMQAASMDCAAAVIAQQIRAGLDGIAERRANENLQSEE
jgi:hypothetical protein